MGRVYLWMRAAFAALAALVTWLTLTANPDSAESGFALARAIAAFVFADPALGDKVAHFLAYAALGAFAFWGRVRFAAAPWATPVALVAYGGGLELLQGLGGVRAAEIADAVANGLGAAAGFAGALLAARVVSRVVSPRAA